MNRIEQAPHLHLTVKETLLPSFHPLLQGGVSLEARSGMSAKEFLTHELGLTQEYLDTVVQTVFLDGKAVDDLGSAFIRDGAIMALSAAMPGLLGATLRRGSFYAAMRKEISYREVRNADDKGTARVTVKIFNLLLGDMGRVLLEKGIWIRGEDLQYFFGNRNEKFWAGCVGALLNGKQVDPTSLSGMEWKEEDVSLRVTVES
ncbi:MAG: hypothetical protein CVU64_10670 [Deltaproteobacteria bacterium HGW-Deltaproteobacteria-21]|nr:MAG: hypothetical protein CVU64_10670 [Deltaproteobacteria bacterium HGW-Deltaproteobacteria-21]